MDIEIGYRNLSRFDIVAPSKQVAGNQVRFVLRRSGMKWKLAEIRLPPD